MLLCLGKVKFAYHKFLQKTYSTKVNGALFIRNDDRRVM
jgi:hypothetical protein